MDYITINIGVQEAKTLLDHAFATYLEGIMPENDPFYGVCVAQEKGETANFFFDGSNVVLEIKK